LRVKLRDQLRMGTREVLHFGRPYPQI